MDDEQYVSPAAAPAAIKAARQWLLQFEWGAEVIDLLDQPEVDTQQWFRQVDLMRRRIDGADSPPFG